MTISAVAALFAAATALFAAVGVKTSPQPDRTVKELWKRYEAAVNSDRPQKQLDILKDIKAAAKTAKSPLDYYDACVKYAQTASSMNWKQRDSLNRAAAAEIEAFGDPMLVFYYGLNDAPYGQSKAHLDFVKEHSKELKASYHPDFQERDYCFANDPTGKFLRAQFQNDYNYALWTLFLRNRDAESEKLLREYIGEALPQAAFIEFIALRNKSGKFDDYLKKYDGTVYSLLAEDYMLSRRFSQLSSDKKSTSEDYRRLRDSCDVITSRLKVFKGDDAKVAACCTNADAVGKSLDAKSLNFSIKDRELEIVVRNLASVEFRLTKDKKEVYKTVLKSAEAPYYVLDTLKVEIPDSFDDGDYVAICRSGSIKSENSYSKHNLSMSIQKRKDGEYIYVCRQLDGKPVDSFDYVLSNNKDSKKYSGKGSCTDGYFKLPDGFSSFAKGRGVVLECSTMENGHRLLTPKMSLWRGLGTYEEEERISEHAKILTDCAAFNPGDTLKFKVLCYTESNAGERSVYPEGCKIEVSFVDSSGKEREGQTLTTNEFGSVAGEFVIPSGVRGGNWLVIVKHKDRRMASTSVVVDDFVLPEYELVFDEPDRLYFPGDTVLVKATLKSYSGHNLSDATVQWSVDGQNGTVVPDADGKLSFTFVADGDESWGSSKYVNVKVTAGTGQTLEFDAYRNICGKLNIWLSAPTDVDKSIAFTVGSNARRQGLNVKVIWEIRKDSRMMMNGESELEKKTMAELSSLQDGRYELYVKVTAKDGKGAEHTAESTAEFVKLASDATSVDFPVSALIRKVEGENISLLLAESKEPFWAVVQLWSDGRVVRNSLVHLNEGETVAHIDWKYEDSYEDVVSLSVIYFREGRCNIQQWEFKRSVPSTALPLEFTRFTTPAAPASLYTLSLKTDAGVEAAATVFDKSSETMRPNVWSPLSTWRRGFSVQDISQNVNGSDGCSYVYYDRMYGARASAGSMKLMSRAPVLSDAIEIVNDEASVEEEAIPFQLEKDPAPDVRSDFREALCFEPFLRSDADGRVEFSFRTSDKLSTYIVQVFAHDKDVRTAALRREMVVTIPVRLSLVPPAYLYKGDVWCPQASLSSNSGSDVSGRVVLSVYAGGEYDKNARPLARFTRENVTVRAGASTTVSFDALPEDIYAALAKAGADTLGVKVDFIAGKGGMSFSDAVFYPVPVYDDFQTVTEFHSAVLLDGADRDALIAALRKAFVNAGGEDAVLKEIRIADMVRAALPELQNPQNDNIFCLLDAYYSNAMAEKLGCAAENNEEVQAELLKKILACVRSDGGFGWFEGMDSSPAVTAQVLWRMAKAGMDDKLGVKVREAACAYLDRSQFASAKERPYWCGGISLTRYMLVRSMYADIPLAAKPDRKAAKYMAEYMTPKKERGLNGQIYAKAVRLQTLLNLCSTPEGEKLASALGVKLMTGSRLQKSIAADYLSLSEYAVSHRSGGMYFPNAVMPFRGLMESEAFTHAMLADLFAEAPEYVGDTAAYAEIADGVRMWLMLQKETQEWGSDPGWCDALASILKASPAVLETRVIALTASVRRPFREIKAAGNGFTLVVKYFKLLPDGKRIELKDGDALELGDKVEAEYSLWSEENRSFVRLNVPRPACLVPEDQLSGLYGVWARPLRVQGWYGFSPVGYRWVRSNATEFWFESFPEEKSTVRETFFVSSNGVFASPAPELECLYAPHYRACAESASVKVTE